MRFMPKHAGTIPFIIQQIGVRAEDNTRYPKENARIEIEDL
jgi:hypothetical protein